MASEEFRGRHTSIAMLSWITGSSKYDKNEPKRIGRNGSSGPEYQAVVAYPGRAESKDVLSVGRNNSVTYAARDKKNGVELVCSAPVGSKHSAKVLDLCNTIYSSGARDSKSLQKQIDIQPRLAIEQRHAAHDVGIDEDPNSEDEQENTRRSPRPAINTYTTDAVRSPKREAQYYAADDEASRRAYESVRHAPENTSRAPGSLVSRHQSEPQEQLHKGYKHDSGTQTTYHVHSQQGELFVSAPNGSGEAKLFNDVASRAGGRGYVSDSLLMLTALQLERSEYC